MSLSWLTGNDITGPIGSGHIWCMGSLVDRNVIMSYKLVTSAKTPFPKRPHSMAGMGFRGF